MRTDYFQKCKLQSVSPPLLHNTAAETSPKQCHVMREGERKQPLFPPFFPKWLRAGRKQLGAETRRGAPRPAQGRAGPFREHLCPRFPLLTYASFLPISHLSGWTNGLQLCFELCTTVEESVRLVLLIVDFPHVKQLFFNIVFILIPRDCVCLYWVYASRNIHNVCSIM